MNRAPYFRQLQDFQLGLNALDFPELFVSDTVNPYRKEFIGWEKVDFFYSDVQLRGLIHTMWNVCRGRDYNLWVAGYGRAENTSMDYLLIAENDNWLTANAPAVRVAASARATAIVANFWLKGVNY